MPSRLTPPQVRAARAMLDWSMVNLAKAARVSVSTVKRFEDGRSIPVSDDAVALMRDALETEGVSFLPDDGNGPGVRLISTGKAEILDVLPLRRKSGS